MNLGHKFMAIWDTGATNSVISQNVIDTCQLETIGEQEVHTTSGEMNTDVHLVDIVLLDDDTVKFPKVAVTRGKVHGADVLIGMDIIRQGDFAVTNFNQVTTFSFRVPSLERIDFKQRAKKQ